MNSTLPSFILLASAGLGDMLSLLAAPMGLEISVVSEGGPPPQFAVLQHPPSPFMINGMGGLTELLQQLQRQRPTIVQRAPTNPCLEVRAAQPPPRK